MAWVLGESYMATPVSSHGACRVTVSCNPRVPFCCFGGLFHLHPINNASNPVSIVSIVSCQSCGFGQRLSNFWFGTCLVPNVFVSSQRNNTQYFKRPSGSPLSLGSARYNRYFSIRPGSMRSTTFANVTFRFLAVASDTLFSPVWLAGLEHGPSGSVSAIRYSSVGVHDGPGAVCSGSLGGSMPCIRRGGLQQL